MIQRAKGPSLAILVVGLTLLGCDSGNVTCMIGSTRCSDNRAQQCIGPNQGGDKDGEWKVYGDCPAQGTVCVEHLVLDSSLDQYFAGCASP
jgi:hypothetical protein